MGVSRSLDPRFPEDTTRWRQDSAVCSHGLWVGVTPQEREGTLGGVPTSRACRKHGHLGSGFFHWASL